MKRVLLITIAALLSISATARERGRVLNVTDFESLVLGDTTIMLVDMRPAQQFEAGHIKGAHNVNLENRRSCREFRHNMGNKKDVALYCKNGSKSRHASKRIKRKGAKVYTLCMGFDDWRRHNKPVSRKR